MGKKAYSTRILTNCVYIFYRQTRIASQSSFVHSVALSRQQITILFKFHAIFTIQFVVFFVFELVSRADERARSNRRKAVCPNFQRKKNDFCVHIAVVMVMGICFGNELFFVSIKLFVQ